MSNRRAVRIEVELPELTPAQADFLWNFLEDLATDIWDVYEPELLAFQDECSRPSEEAENDMTADDCEGLFTNGPAPPVNDDDSDPNPNF